jgi:hypothetical protein
MKNYTIQIFIAIIILIACFKLGELKGKYDMINEAKEVFELNIDTTPYKYLDIGFNFGDNYYSFPFSMEELKGLAYQKFYPENNYNPWLKKEYKGIIEQLNDWEAIYGKHYRSEVK